MPKRNLSRANIDTESKYNPLCGEIKLHEDSIFNYDANMKFSTNIDYSRFEYGFHHFIHANKNKMEKLKQFEGKKKVYLVMNDFERYIDNYEDNIGNASTAYFELKNKPKILSRGFYKLWEIFYAFDIIDVNKDGFVSAHLAEGPGSFIQATMFYRDMFGKKSKNDKYYAVTLHPEDSGNHVPPLEKEFVDYYDKEKPKRFMLHKTYSNQQGGDPDKDNGDITDPKTIKLFGGEMKEKADLVTGDGGFEWSNENVQEQESFRLILGQIVAASKIQKKGGTFVCKFFETFSLTSIKFIALLTSLYENVYFIKPLMSRPSNSEKYLVCMNFKYNDNDKGFKDISKKMDKLIDESHKNKELNIVDIFSDFVPNRDFLDKVVQMNVDIANHQLLSINNIIKFIDDQNYYGDVYQDHRVRQIEASKFWIDLFLGDYKKLERSREIYKKSIDQGTKDHNARAKDLGKRLVASI